MRLKLILILTLLTSMSGCGVFVAERLMDKSVEMAERMEEISAKRMARLRAEEYLIEGTIKKTEMIEVERTTETISQETKEEIESELEKEFPNKTEVTIKTKVKKVKRWTVTFEDGREMEFSKVPAKPLDKGVYYKITYNGLDEITIVQKIENASKN